MLAKERKVLLPYDRVDAPAAGLKNVLAGLVCAEQLLRVGLDALVGDDNELALFFWLYKWLLALFDYYVCCRSPNYVIDLQQSIIVCNMSCSWSFLFKILVLIEMQTGKRQVMVTFLAS